MKRKIAWLMSAMMLFSSIPSGSVNVLAESTQQEAEILSDSAGISDAEQNMAEDSIQNVSAEPTQDVSAEVFPEAGEVGEEASVFGDGDEQPDRSLGNDTQSAGQEVTADSIFSDAADSGGEFEPGSETGPEEISIGSNTLNITAGMLKNCKFTAPEDGTYRFRIISEWISSMTIEDSYGDGLYMEPSEDKNFMDWSMEKDEICYVDLNVAEGADESLELSVKRLCEVHTPAEDSVVVTDSTCTEEGYTTYTCEVCEESFTVDYTEASGHQYVETGTVEPDCDDYGYTTYTCENCGESYTDNYTDALGHQYVETGKVSPDCDDDGYTIYTCEICRQIFQDNYVEALGHKYTEVEKKDATCTEEGFIKYICDVCEEEYYKYIDPYHQLDESGRCTICQEMSSNVMMNAELTVEDDETFIAVEYDTKRYCSVYIEVYEEGAEELFLRKVLSASPDETTGKVLIDAELPQYYIIKAYLIDTDTEIIISNTFTNLFHTRDFQELDDYVPSVSEEERTVDLSEGNFGVFKEDTVVVHGNAEVNTLADTSYESVTYTLTNTDDQADSIVADCNLAYFYDDDLKLVVHVSGVSRPAEGTVTITVEQPELEEVFEKLRIETIVQDQVCTVDISGLPQGVSYGSTASAVSTQDAAAAVAGASGLAETQTTLSASQEYSFTGAKISNAELNGKVSVDMKFPIKLYITHSQQMMQFGVDTSLTGNVSVEGEGSLEIPLGSYWVPLMNGVMYIKTNPKYLMKTEGSISVGVSAAGSVLTQTDNANGFQVLSKSFDANDWEIKMEGSFFCGLQVKPELYISPKYRLAGVSLEVGPEATASLSAPIPEEEQEEGDHTCKLCIDGDGDIVVKLNADITAFKKKVSSSTTFKLRGFEFYYSFDHSKWGRGICPYVKGMEEIPDEDWDSETGTKVSIMDNGIDYYFTLHDDGTCTLNACCRGGSGTLTLPSTLYYNNQAYSVTKYDGTYDGPYNSYSFFEHLIIPESIREFRNLNISFPCLETVEFSGDREYINNKAFEDCGGLKSVEIPESVKWIGESAFKYCCGLESIIIPEGVTIIGDSTFSCCCNLKSITIPGSVTEIRDCAFDNCSNLKNITIPDNVTTIGHDAFAGCSSITEFVVPDSVTSIGINVFADCINLKRLVLGKNVNHVGHLESRNGNEGIYAEEFIFDGVKAIEEDAFQGYDITEITIPDSVESIGDGAFSYCGELKEITLPDSVKTVGGHAFSYCNKLTEMTIGKNVEISIESWGCEATLTNVYLAEGRTEIEPFAFLRCTGLKSVVLPESMERIGISSFTGCSSLEEISFPAGIKYIDIYAFSGCTSLKKIFIPSGMKIIDRGAFAFCTGLTQAVIAGRDTEVYCYMTFPGKGECPDLQIYGLYASIARFTVSNQNFTPLVRIDEEGHGYVTDRVITPSTCVKPGEHVVKCILCGDCGKTYTEEMPVSDNHEEEVEDALVPASIGVSGKTAGSHCTACEKTVVEQETIPAIKTVALSRTSYTYNEKMQRPSVTVTDTKGTRLTSAAYTVQYPSGCTNAGTYAVKVIFKGNYKGNKSLSYKILPASQTITVKVSTRTYSYSAVKAKAQTFTVGALAKTALSYKSSNTKYVTVDKNGKVTIKKGTPGGTYKITVTAAKSTNYYAASKDVIIKINPVSQTIKTKVSSKTYKYAAVKAGKQTFSIGATAKTSLSYKSSNTKYITVSKKGTVTVKKGTPKGTYKVTVTAAKSANYKAATKVIKIKIS